MRFEVEGVVLKIDRGSKHDGPGLRTVVFLKGCPLRCEWCSTPDSQTLEPLLLNMETLCVRCGRCIAACPRNALGFVDDTAAGKAEEDGKPTYPVRLRVDHARCDVCGACLDECLNSAMRVSGVRMSVDEVYDVIHRSRGFWRRMQGGVTLSGGEALFQFEFTLALLKKCHDSGIDTNIETSCFAPGKKIRALLPYLDHACCDIKHVDDAAHKRLTGVSNRLILENIRMISHEKDLILRYPVIPGRNDSRENIDAVAAFIKTLGPRFNRIDLMGYHELGAITYKRMGLGYALEGVPAMNKDDLARVGERMAACGINAVLA